MDMHFHDIQHTITMQEFRKNQQNFKLSLEHILSIKKNYKSNDPKLLNEYKKSFDKIDGDHYVKRTANNLEDTFMNSKTMMLSIIESLERSKLKDKTQRPTNILVYELYLGVIAEISSGKVFYLDYFRMMGSSNSDQNWVKDLFDECFHTVACSMRKSFGIIGKRNYTNAFINAMDSDELINDVSNYYTGKITADKGL